MFCADLDTFSPLSVRQESPSSECVSGLAAMTDDVTSSNRNRRAAMIETRNYNGSRLIAAGKSMGDVIGNRDDVIKTSGSAGHVALVYR